MWCWVCFVVMWLVELQVPDSCQDRMRLHSKKNLTNRKFLENNSEDSPNLIRLLRKLNVLELYETGISTKYSDFARQHLLTNHPLNLVYRLSLVFLWRIFSSYLAEWQLLSIIISVRDIVWVKHSSGTLSYHLTPTTILWLKTCLLENKMSGLLI